jgi:branched-chain amino acid transport system substrate-binding protein
MSRYIRGQAGSVFLLLAVLAVLGLVLAGCGGGTEATTSSAPTTTAASPSSTAAASTGSTSAAGTAKVAVKQWDVPVLLMMSGAYAGFGEQIKWMMDTTVAEINAAGGVAGVPMVLDYRDTALDPAKATAEMAKVVEKNLIIWGPMTSVEGKAAFPLAVQNKVFITSPWNGTDITAEFAPYNDSYNAPYALCVPPPVAGWAKLFPEMKTVAQFTMNADPTWTSIAKSTSDTLAAAGVTMTEIDVQAGVDVGSVVVKAMSGNPDGISIVCDPTTAAKIAIELDKRGFANKGHILFFTTDDDPALFSTAGAALNGTYIWSFADQTNADPRWQALRKAWQAKSGQNAIGAIQMAYYDVIYLQKQAIEETGVTGDPAKLAEERQKLTEWWQNVKGFKGLMGTWDIVSGYGQVPAFLFKITDGVARTYEKAGTYAPLPAK